MGCFDDLLRNDDYERGLVDGEERYRERVIGSFSNFVDKILDDELNKTFPKINYEFSLLVRDNQKCMRMINLLEKMINEKDEIIDYQEKKLDECLEILKESRDEIVRLQKKCGESDNG